MSCSWADCEGAVFTSVSSKDHRVKTQCSILYSQAHANKGPSCYLAVCSSLLLYYSLSRYASLPHYECSLSDDESKVVVRHRALAGRGMETERGETILTV